MSSSDSLKTIAIECPCCGAELVIDVETRSVLLHTAKKTQAAFTDLATEVARLREASAERELSFQRSLEAEKSRETRMDRKFDELLRRAKEAPGEKPIKDIDL